MCEKSKEQSADEKEGKGQAKWVKKFLFSQKNFLEKIKE